jgi:hypothetical protein
MGFGEAASALINIEVLCFGSINMFQLVIALVGRTNLSFSLSLSLSLSFWVLKFVSNL